MSSSKQLDEDDIDELDDVLDQFSHASTEAGNTQATGKDASPSKPSPCASDAGSTASAATHKIASVEEEDADDGIDEGLPPGIDDALSKQFAAELARGMDEMFGPGASAAAKDAASSKEASVGPGLEPEMSEDEMMKQFGKIMAEMGLGGRAGSSGTSAGVATTAGSSSVSTAEPQRPADFQDAIKLTMSRLRESSSSTAGGSGGSDPFGDFSEEDLAKLLSSLGENGEVPEGEEGMTQMLEKMMGELMSKEVLYEPLKELRDKYPPFFESLPNCVAERDMKRYKEQHRCVSEVVRIFESPEFDDGPDAEKKKLKSRVSELMAEVQEAGAPPKEVVGEMPEGLENIAGLGGAGGPGGEDCVVM